jgi:polysaccharide export outer membrane protein
LPLPVVSPNGPLKKRSFSFAVKAGEETVIRIDYKGIVKGKDFSQNVEIKADDTIVVPVKAMGW